MKSIKSKGRKNQKKRITSQVEKIPKNVEILRLKNPVICKHLDKEKMSVRTFSKQLATLIIIIRPT